MNFQIVIDRLEVLRSRKGFSASDKIDIAIMYRYVFAKDFIKTSCNDCYRDAVIEMYIHLKNNGFMKEKCNYLLKNGVLLQEFGSPEMYTNANLTDKVAESYLANNPKGQAFFASLPSDWEERIRKRQNPETNLDENLMQGLIDALRKGKEVEMLKNEFKSYQINGKKVTSKVLSAHLKEAVIAYDELKALEETDQTKE